MVDDTAEDRSPRRRRPSLYVRFGKRTLDLVVGSMSLLLLAPLLATIALLVKVEDGSPVFFIQMRPGRHEKPFALLKFRTMSVADPSRPLRPDAIRLTRLGAFLRRWSIDELPQLINVIRGDMSLMGPRPLLMRYLPYFTPRERKRFDVRPGITGWAQVHGRNALDWDSRLALDSWYVEACSLQLDVGIMLMTVRKVVSGDGVVADASIQIPELDRARGGVPLDRG